MQPQKETKDRCTDALMGDLRKAAGETGERLYSLEEIRGMLDLRDVVVAFARRKWDRLGREESFDDLSFIRHAALLKNAQADIDDLLTVIAQLNECTKGEVPEAAKKDAATAIAMMQWSDERRITRRATCSDAAEVAIAAALPALKDEWRRQVEETGGPAIREMLGLATNYEADWCDKATEKIMAALREVMG